MSASRTTGAAMLLLRAVVMAIWHISSIFISPYSVDKISISIRACSHVWHAVAQAVQLHVAWNFQKSLQIFPQGILLILGSFIRKHMERLKRFWNDIAGNEVDYSQFETRNGGDSDIVVFRDKSSKFMLFGTNIHVVLGATIAATIGLMVTITFCVIYTFYHHRGQGRNHFIDHLELVDLIFALFFGLPCHYLLFYGIHRENKRYLTPFLIFYCTNFVLNVIFSAITVIAAIIDARRLLYGQVKYDFGWIAFQLGFTTAQGFAIYLVLRCRKYLSAKEHWKKISSQGTNNMDHSIIADGVVAEPSLHDV